jgi:hypothetical protein
LAEAALDDPGHGIADATQALNKAALIASDAGMADFAQDLCWQHIDVYSHLARPLTILEARYLLEPVLNLARLQIRAEQGRPALQLLNDLYQAVSQRGNLSVGGQTLPLGNLAGDQAGRRQLREWTWLQLLGEGIRTLALAGRWTDAADHARAHNGVGAHLMEGRQAVIIAALLQDNLPESRALLAAATPTQPWEGQVAACLQMMCSAKHGAITAHHLATATPRPVVPGPAANYASYRARLGLTLAILAGDTHPAFAAKLLNRVAQHAIHSGDGYAARDVLGFREAQSGITEIQQSCLRNIAAEAGLGLGILPDGVVRSITTTADTAATALNTTLHAATRAER